MLLLVKPSPSTAKRFDTDDQRWQAIIGRDPAAPGVFLYGVATTRIFCHPRCPSRLPRRENIRFFSSIAEAHAAGFRPCKRCQPGGLRLEDQHTALITNACRILRESDPPPTLHDLAKQVGMSAYHLQRTFKRLTGITPKAYTTAHRADRVRAALAESRSVTEAIYRAGYQSSARFYEKSSEILGMTPQESLRHGADTAIRHTVRTCSLGELVVAATSCGICFIALGGDAEPLLRDLRKRFSRATFLESDPALEALVTQVVANVEDPSLGWKLPLDIRGTAFQQRVWAALRTIPAGATASYTDIAEQIGAPSAVRAVAQACGANKLAVAIPCHRILRRDGGISGYRWGVGIKRELLRKEAAIQSKH